MGKEGSVALVVVVVAVVDNRRGGKERKQISRMASLLRVVGESINIIHVCGLVLLYLAQILPHGNTFPRLLITFNCVKTLHGFHSLTLEKGWRADDPNARNRSGKTYRTYINARAKPWWKYL